MLHSSLSCTPLLVTRLSLSLSYRRLSRVILRLHSPAPPSSVCRSLSAAATRRIERKRTRTGPKQPPVNRDHFPLSSLSSSAFRLPSSVVHPRRPLCRPYSSVALPFSCGRSENFTMRNTIPAKYRPSHFSARSFFVCLFIFLYLSPYLPARGPTFFPSSTCSRFLFRSLLLPAAAFRARFIPTRPCGNVSSTAILGFFSYGLFLASSNFSRVSNIRVIFQRAKIPRENCRAVRCIKCRCLRSI